MTTTSVKIYNSFDVTEADFRDISCIECAVNGRHFECLVLCADCGHFLCRDCIGPHMKNSDENHNAPRSVKDGTKINENVSTLSNEEPPSINRPPYNGSEQAEQLKNAQQELEILRSALEQLQALKSAKVELASAVKKVAYDRLSDFRTQVLQELSVLESEVKNNIDTQVTEYINRLDLNIDQIRNKIVAMNSLLDSMQNLAGKKSNESRETTDWSWCLQELRFELKALDKKKSHMNELNIEAMERELLNSAKQPLDYFSYKVTKLNPFLYVDDKNPFLDNWDERVDESFQEDKNEETVSSPDEINDLREGNEISEPTTDSKIVSDINSVYENENDTAGFLERENESTKEVLYDTKKNPGETKSNDDDKHVHNCDADSSVNMNDDDSDDEVNDDHVDDYNYDNVSDDYEAVDDDDNYNDVADVNS